MQALHAVDRPLAGPARPIRIAAADAGHAAAIATIYRDHLAHGLAVAEDPVPDAAAIAGRLEAIRAAGLPALVALDERGIVRGYAWARPWRERAGYRHTVEDSIYVARGARRRGVGHRLLGSLIEACAAVGCRRLVAVVGDARNRASIRLHEALGFSACGFLPGAALGRDRSGAPVPLDVVVLMRALVAEKEAGRA